MKSGVVMVVIVSIWDFVFILLGLDLILYIVGYLCILYVILSRFPREDVVETPRTSTTHHLLGNK